MNTSKQEFLIRENISPTGKFLLDGKQVKQSWGEIHHMFQVDGIIRIQKMDFSFIPASGHFRHFNLEHTGHAPGNRYLLAEIDTPGYFIEDDQEVMPVINLSRTQTSICLAVRHRVPYEALTAEDFSFSLPSIQNACELKQAIIWRYHQSLPNISRETLLSRGVSITDLEIIPQL